jgi:glycosyltransferase involved in cell wall biosynthesis
VKVLVVNNMAPFVWGGAEELASNLVRQLQKAGLQSELLRVPFKWDPYPRLIDEMLLCRSMRLVNVDRMISMKFPAYLIPHHHKTMWISHQYRQAYDLWDSGHSNIADTPEGHEVRGAIMSADRVAFAEARKVFGVSRVIQDRLRKYNGLDCEVMMPPLNDPERFTGGAYGDYLFAGGRVSAGKRQHLLVEAMAHVKSSRARLVVAGPPDTPEDARRLQNLVDKFDLGGRVTLDLRFLAREEYARLMNEALACAYLPLDEDSVGYVTMEAFEARKGVITVTDSGGVTDIVRHGETGLVSAPDPVQLAENVDRMFSARSRAQSMGRAGHGLWNDLGVTWPRTIERLVS